MTLRLSKFLFFLTADKEMDHARCVFHGRFGKHTVATPDSDRNKEQI